MLSSNSPEEWWLPAWTLNREPSTTPVQRTTQQLCMRLNISFRASRVPFRYVQKAEDDLACPQRPGSFRYYAVKRFSRDASDVVVAGILNLSLLASLAAAGEDESRVGATAASTAGGKYGATVPAAAATCARARAARGRFPKSDSDNLPMRHGALKREGERERERERERVQYVYCSSIAIGRVHSIGRDANDNTAVIVHRYKKQLQL